MALFRAVPESRLGDANKQYYRYDTVRIPSNVPYVVDNLWEWLRPINMPSRRHAVYASPTPELALANASARLEEGDRYIACRVIIEPQAVKIAQLSVRDAREHKDIRTIMGWLGKHSTQVTEIPTTEKQRLSMLFMPGLHRDELEALRQEHPFVQQVCESAQELSIFWSSALREPQDSEGELFFELAGSQISYGLERI
ncbi:hypothetical protein EGJ52_22945 [Pseudomonas luteola]|uniref:hypothetical protein n=1 Tax=Pseudomonas luteola TaxID=47886 RepID=UPI000F777DBF|nr:hypothetical protein [Pseudomonas luteola]RRW39978.1 hypothetical protein EGJ52_22945 [Pseudomonas luteola]